jgi:transcriptional regulator with GAF, ATPase, and Fis domain
LLFSEDPRQKLDRIVAYVVRESESRGGALLSVESDKLVPCITRGVELERLAGVQAHWEQARPTLEKGRVRLEGESILAPVSQGDRLVGVLYLDRPRRFDEADTEMLRELLGRGLAAPAVPSAVATFLSTASPEEVAREHFLLILQQNEWNIARVARSLGVTRPTVYARLERYGIDRKKVPKTLKKLAPA